MTPPATAAAAAAAEVSAAGASGHNRTGSGPLLMGQRGDWEGRLPTLYSVTGGSQNAYPTLGMGGNWVGGGVHSIPVGGHPGDFFASNGSGSNGGLNPHHQDRSPRLLQHVRSKDDLDALRPRKIRRTGPFFDQDDNQGGKSGADRGGDGGGEGDEAGKSGGHLMNVAPSAKDTDGGGGPGFQLAAFNFYAAMSAVVSSTGGAGGSGILGAGGLGLTAHARSRMAEVKH